MLFNKLKYTLFLTASFIPVPASAVKKPEAATPSTVKDAVVEERLEPAAMPLTVDWQMTYSGFIVEHGMKSWSQKFQETWFLEQGMGQWFLRNRRARTPIAFQMARGLLEASMQRHDLLQLLGVAVADDQRPLAKQTITLGNILSRINYRKFTVRLSEQAHAKIFLALGPSTSGGNAAVH